MPPSRRCVVLQIPFACLFRYRRRASWGGFHPSSSTTDMERLSSLLASWSAANILIDQGGIPQAGNITGKGKMQENRNAQDEMLRSQSAISVTLTDGENSDDEKEGLCVSGLSSVLPGGRWSYACSSSLNSESIHSHLKLRGSESTAPEAMKGN